MRKLYEKKLTDLFRSGSALLFALVFRCEAQQKEGPEDRISARLSTRSAPLCESFLQGLRELGYVEGKNIIIEYR